MKRYGFLTDPHLKLFQKIKFVHHINSENLSGIFITGDLTEGLLLENTLEYIGKNINCDVFFILGNHCCHSRSFSDTYNLVRNICKKYPKLKWMEDINDIALNDDVGIIGKMGWYSGLIGNRNYIKYTFDHFLINDFKGLSWDDKFAKFQELSRHSADLIEEQLVNVLEKYKVIYLLTHFPPFVEANLYRNRFDKMFWESYNTNSILGDRLKNIMENYKKRQLIVLAGHSHNPLTGQITRNIECRVGDASYLFTKKDQIFVI